MAQDDDIADRVIPGGLRKSRSYHRDCGPKISGEIRDLAVQIHPITRLDR